MKVINKVCQILAIVFGLGALVLFFVPFANVTTGSETVSLVGAQLAFGTKATVGKVAYNMAKSADILFCLILTAFAAVMSLFSAKSKSLRYVAPGLGLISAIYMLVIALSSPWKFVDKRPLPSVSNIVYSDFVIILAIALFVFAAFAIAYLLIDDYLEVLASKGEKKTICQRIGLFFRDNKSEVKKIVWPSLRDVIKNTIIVLIMCLIVGALIWAVDFGLGRLIEAILGVKPNT
jgi:preprotein translocase subunit SecE